MVMKIIFSINEITEIGSFNYSSLNQEKRIIRATLFFWEMRIIMYVRIYIHLTIVKNIVKKILHNMQITIF